MAAKLRAVLKPGPGSTPPVVIDSRDRSYSARALGARLKKRNNSRASVSSPCRPRSGVRPPLQPFRWALSTSDSETVQPVNHLSIRSSSLINWKWPSVRPLHPADRLMARNILASALDCGEGTLQRILPWRLRHKTLISCSKPSSDNPPASVGYGEPARLFAIGLSPGYGPPCKIPRTHASSCHYPRHQPHTGWYVGVPNLPCAPSRPLVKEARTNHLGGIVSPM